MAFKPKYTHLFPLKVYQLDELYNNVLYLEKV